MPAMDEIIKTAKEAGATDVHITVGLPPKMRVNGNLITMNYPKMMSSDTVEILLEIMTEIQRERFEERGEYDMAFSFPGVARCRVHAYKQQGCVTLAIRLLEEHIAMADMLGIPAQVSRIYEKEKGLVLFTGGNGSGKTTTAAAVLNEINSRKDVHILTLERPIEYLYQAKRAVIDQREIGMDSESYASALLAAMREDADVIMLGELNDAEVARMAIAAAETGHLVLAVLPVAIPQEAVDYLVELFLPHRQQQMRRRIQNILEMIVYQEVRMSADGSRRRIEFEVFEREKLS